MARNTVNWLRMSPYKLGVSCVETRNLGVIQVFCQCTNSRGVQGNVNQLNDSISAGDNGVLLVDLCYGLMPAGSKRLAGSPRWWEGELRYPWETVGGMGSPGSVVEEVKESLMSPLCEKERFKKPTGEQETGEIHVEHKTHILDILMT